MNYDNFEKLIHNLQSINMTKEEKKLMKNRLSTFVMDQQAQKSPYYSIMSIAQRSLAMAFLVMLSVGGLTHVAAQNALPGDTLYKFKLTQEEITLATKNTDEKKITYEIQRTEKRIQEAAKLAQADKLDENTQKEIAENIKEQSEKVQKHIEEIKEENPEQALVFNSELKSTIKINSEALRQVSTRKQAKKLPEEQTPSKENIEDSEITDTPESTESNEISEPTQLDIPKLEEVLPIEKSIAIKIIGENNEGEDDFEEISIAETLLGEIAENIKNIEQDEVELTETIIKKAQPEQEPAQANQNPEQHIEQGEPSKKETPKPEQEEAVLYTLEKVVKLKEEIQKLKGSDESFHLHTKKITLDDGTEETEVSFNEELLRTQARNFLEEGAYEKAFLIYQKIREHIKEEMITKEVIKDLGVSEMNDTSIESEEIIKKVIGEQNN